MLIKAKTLTKVSAYFHRINCSGTERRWQSMEMWHSGRAWLSRPHWQISHDKSDQNLMYHHEDTMTGEAHAYSCRRLKPDVSS